MNELERGRLAAEVLDNPVYVEAYESIEKGLINAWREAKTIEDREHLHQMQRMLRKVNSVLESAMNSGKVEQDKLQREQKRNLLQFGSRR